MDNLTQAQSNISKVYNFSSFQVENDSPFQYMYIRIIFGILYSLVFLGCITGNALVMFVIIKHQRMRNITNFFLANLAASDICVGAFCVIPNLMSFYTPYWYAGKVMCKLYFFMQCVSYTSSIIILTVISMERYFAIIHPMLSRRLSRMALMRVIIIVVWLCAVAYGIPSLIAYDTIELEEEGRGHVAFCMSVSTMDLRVMILINFVLWYCLPLLLMSAMYSNISIVLWHSTFMAASAGNDTRKPLAGRKTPKKQPQEGYGANSKSHCHKKLCKTVSSMSEDDNSEANHANEMASGRHMDSSSGRNHHKPLHKASSDVDGCNTQVPHREAGEKLKQTGAPTSSGSGSGGTGSNNALSARRKVIRLLMAIVASFAACMLPHHVRLLYEMWSPPNYNPSFTHHLVPPFTFLFFYLNSALNPILYAFLSDNFRNSLLEVCGCRKRKRPGGMGTRNGVTMARNTTTTTTTTTLCTRNNGKVEDL